MAPYVLNELRSYTIFECIWWYRISIILHLFVVGDVNSKFKQVWLRLVKLYALTISFSILYACHEWLLFNDVQFNKLYLIGIVMGSATNIIGILPPIAAGDIHFFMLNRL